MASAGYLEQLKSVNDWGAVNKLLHDVLGKERAIQGELEQRLLHRKDVETDLLSLTADSSEILQLANADAENLTAAVASTARRAREASQRVRLLDTAQSNLVATLEKIRVIITKTECVSGVQAALDSQEYEKAADHICTYQQLQRQGEQDGSVDAEQSATQTAVLNSARQKLLEAVRGKLKDALQSQDSESVGRLLRLYKPLDRADEGMEATSSFLRSVARRAAGEELTALLDRLAAGTSAPDFLGAVSRSLRVFYVEIKRFGPLVAEVFGSTRVPDLLKQAIIELNDQMPSFFERFIDHYAIGRTVQDVTTKAAAPDPVAVDRALHELRALLACSQEFRAFVLRTAADAAGPPKAAAAIGEVLRSGAFGRKLHELQAGYVILEEYYVERCVAKAIDLDTTLEGALMSSVLDDAFFIMKQAVARATGIGILHCFVSVMTVTITVLGGPLHRTLSAKASGCVAAVLAATTGDAPATAGSREAATAPLNNIARSVGYVSKMREAVEAQAVQRFDGPADSEAVRSVLLDLQAAGNRLQATCSKVCASLVDAMLQGPLKAPLDLLAKQPFNIDDAQYAASEADGGWVRPLCGGLEGIWRALQPALCQPAQEEVLHVLLTRIAARTDSIVASKKFSILGALLLDKEVRSLVSYLTDITSQPVRETFVHLSQVVEILTLEQLDEMRELWTDDSISWRLTEGEVKTVLSQRVDFDRTQIAHLKL